MDTVIQVKNIFVPWDYAVISAYIPKDGEMVCIKNAPNFTGQNRTVMGDGTHNVAWLIAQIVITPSELQQEILAEQAARIQADNAHAALTEPHGATATPAANRIAMYGASSGLKSNKVPAESNDVIRKIEMDTEITARANAISAEETARVNADAGEAAVRQGQFDSLAEGKLDKKPDGTNALVGSDGKLSQAYLPSAILGALIYGGTFSATGIINASSYAGGLQGIKIDNVNTAQYPGYYFISQETYVFGGNNFTPGDWAISQGDHTPAWVEIDNGNAVSSVNGKIGAVVLSKADVELVNVDNTPDSQKPVSQAQQAAIDAASQASQASVTQEAQARIAADAQEAQAREDADTDIQAQLDGIPDVYAPINSPHFTGIPTTPEPGYTVLDQVADVRGLIQMRALILITLLPGARATRTPNSFMAPLRVTRRNRVRGTYAA
jgi:hypothetical protein